MRRREPSHLQKQIGAKMVEESDIDSEEKRKEMRREQCYL